MRRYHFLAAALLASVVMSGCAGNTTRSAPVEIFPDMDRQAKYKPQMAGPFFEDGRASRRPVPGTVAIGYLKEDESFHSGVNGNMYVGRNPLPIDAELLARGRQRYDIYCSPCHSRVGSEVGIVGKRSMWLPTNLQEDRIREMPDGEIFSVISEGRRQMPAYRFQIEARDRWAIVAYMRALHRANNATMNDVPADLRSELR
ncbi:MAG: c-type cytochrome [Bryobacteraceae bacterium]